MAVKLKIGEKVLVRWEVRKVDNKEYYEKTEEFAKKIVRMAKEDGLTVRELYAAADTAQGIVYNSMVDTESIEKTDFPSRYIVDTDTCDEKELFRD